MHGKIIPVTILTGFLGAGKTTLLNELLRRKNDGRIALLVNDVGEVNLDASLIQRSGCLSKANMELVALTNGCICCSLRDDFIRALLSLLRSQDFDAVLIEASGLSEPSQLIQSLSLIDGSEPESGYPVLVYLDNVVSVVDAGAFYDRLYKAPSPAITPQFQRQLDDLQLKQLEYASTLILNKIEGLEESQLRAVREVLRALVPTARILETNFCQVEEGEILGTGRFDRDAPSHSTGWARAFTQSSPPPDTKKEGRQRLLPRKYSPHAGIRTFVYCRRRPFCRERFVQWMETDFPSQSIRCKGLTWFSEEDALVYVFDQAMSAKALTWGGIWAAADEPALPEDLSDTEQADWDDYYGDRINRLVFIGADMDPEKISSALDACLGVWSPHTQSHR